MFCWYNSSEYVEVLPTFYEDYCYIQDEFFKLLSVGVGVEAENLYKYYTEFHHTTDHTKYENSILGKGHQDFYKKVYNRTYFSLPLTVNEARTQFDSTDK